MLAREPRSINAQGAVLAQGLRKFLRRVGAAPRQDGVVLGPHALGRAVVQGVVRQSLQSAVAQTGGTRDDISRDGASECYWGPV